MHIHHHSGIFSLFWNQKNNNIHHLINAHNANNHTINCPTKFTVPSSFFWEHISSIHNIIPKIPITNKIEIYWVCWFLIALAIADIPESNKDIHSKIFIHFQNPEGWRIVKIPHIISNTANQSITQSGHHFFISKSTLKYKVKKYIIISHKKSMIIKKWSKWPPIINITNYFFQTNFNRVIAPEGMINASSKGIRISSKKSG